MAESESPQNQQQSLLLPLRTRVTLFFYNAAADASLRRDGTVSRLPGHLLDYIGFKTPPNPKPHNGVSTYDITVDPSRNLWFRVYVPSQPHSQLPVVVFFHGGGFVLLYPDFKFYDVVCRRFARKIQAVVVSVNYRLAPEYRYPAQYEDGFDVLRFLDDRRDILPENADLSRCFLAGDSAGANLAYHVTKHVCQSKFTHLKVLGVVAIQPFFGGEDRTKSEIDLEEVDVFVSTKRTDLMWKAFIPPGEGMDRDHEVINVSGPKAADISKLDFPATMVVVGGFDSLKDRQIEFYEWLKKSGKEAYMVNYPNMFHAFYLFPELPESGQLIAEAKQFIQEQCSKVVN